MKTDIEIVDRGRGLQLSTSRVTVQDLVPYFQEGCSYEEIIRWIPTLSADEIAVVERYYREHQEALDEEDRQIRERNAARKNPEWMEKLLVDGKSKLNALREKLRHSNDKDQISAPADDCIYLEKS